MELIDIIIPCYNITYELLDRALSSVKAQVCQNYICTVVDDCSDNSDIIRELCNKHHVGYIRKEINEGPGMARQTGVDNTHCPYIIFLDSDDVLMPFATYIFGDVTKTTPEENYFGSSLFIKDFNKQHFVPVNVEDTLTWLHGKMFKRSFLVDNKIRFISDIRMDEDGYFNTICYELNNATIGLIKDFTYIFERRNNSFSSNQNPDDSINNFLYSMRKCSDFLGEKFTSAFNTIWRQVKEHPEYKEIIKETVVYMKERGVKFVPSEKQKAQAEKILQGLH